VYPLTENPSRARPSALCNAIFFGAVIFLHSASRLTKQNGRNKRCFPPSSLSVSLPLH